MLVKNAGVRGLGDWLDSVGNFLKSEIKTTATEGANYGRTQLFGQGGGLPQSTMIPTTINYNPAPAATALPSWAPWAIGGGILLLGVVLMRGRGGGA